MAARATPRRARRFYASALSEAERADLSIALKVDGVEEEIALLRLRLRQALVQRPDDLPLMFKGIDLLSRALARRYHLSKQDAGEISESIRGVLTEHRAEERLDG